MFQNAICTFLSNIYCHKRNLTFLVRGILNFRINIGQSNWWCPLENRLGKGALNKIYNLRISRNNRMFLFRSHIESKHYINFFLISSRRLSYLWPVNQREIFATVAITLKATILFQENTVQTVSGIIWKHWEVIKCFSAK